MRAFIVVLAGLWMSAHGQVTPDRLFEYRKVPIEDRENLKRHCADIPLEHWSSSEYVMGCLAGWNVQPFDWGDTDGVFTAVQAVPYGLLTIACDKEKKDETRIINVFFCFKNIATNVSRDHSVSTDITRKEDRVHLELGFSQVVPDSPFGVRFKEEIIKYPWPSRSWRAWNERHLEDVIGKEDTHIARFYNDEAVDIIRKIYRSRYVHFTDRKTGESNTVLVTSQAPTVIKEIMSHCDRSQP